MKEENPHICEEIDILERNFEDELLRLGWEMEQEVVIDCDNEQEEVMMYEDIADMKMMEEELDALPIAQVGPGS